MTFSALAETGGWLSRVEWVEDVVPWIAEGYGKSATGKCWIRAGLEVAE